MAPVPWCSIASVQINTMRGHGIVRYEASVVLLGFLSPATMYYPQILVILHWGWCNFIE